MSTTREELVTDIMQHPWLVKGEFTGACPSCPDLTIEGGHNSPSHAGHIADALLAAGYRKPRTVTTAEDLDQLDESAILRSRGGDAFQQGEDFHQRKGWFMNGTVDPLTSMQVAKFGPFSVLFETQP
jgi:hypothetical protein